MKHSFFAIKAMNTRAALRAGLESDDKGVSDPSRVPQEPIAPKNPSVLKDEGVCDESKAKKEFGQDSKFADNEQELDVIAEQQAAMEALYDAVVRGNRIAASLEEMADQLDASIAPDPVTGAVDPDAGLSPEAAGVLQTSLNASEVGEAGEMVALESFQIDRRTATKQLANTMRARAAVVTSRVSGLRQKFDI